MRVRAGMIVFPALMASIYFLFNQPPVSEYKELLIPLEYLFLFLFLGSVTDSLGVPVLPTLLRGAGIAVFVYTYPAIPQYNPTELNFQTGCALLIVGLTIMKIASDAPRRADLLIRGVGTLLVFMGISRLLTDNGFPTGWSRLVLYLGFAPLLVYIFAFLESLAGESFLERHAKGLIIAVGLILIYGWGREYLSVYFPELAFFIDIALLGITLGIIALLLSRFLSSPDIEGYLIGEWEKHEARVKISEDNTLKEARELIDDFVVHKKKLPLLAYLSYYGSKVLSSPEELEKLIEPLAEYHETPRSSLTPGWLVKKYERIDMERRIKIVEEVIRRLKGRR
ncbi:hypothetical protein E3E31_01205 [Thermococcus sp. M39]|uniref:hypothetical protein n=1 Tax=unclassified Thermococcus TaxID=2627626 RepID=UPI00143A4EDA|nr:MULTISPECIES: hypothetical protein [unclassified Thermococcus]NJE07173.1 hypothetical protein [Thermococcus sp. M39]NJE12695.1 hypothetical protein [Thermococcus sp. LS2]